MVKIGLSVLKTGGVPILNWNTVQSYQTYYKKEKSMKSGKGAIPHLMISSEIQRKFHSLQIYRTHSAVF